MTQLSRLPRLGRIDRAAPILFTFNGQVLEGYRGDTAASALLANGIHHVARSFKYHRPRGVLAAGSEEPNALLDVDRGAGRRDPNNRATVVEIFDGLRLQSQNHWPSLGFDIGALNDKAGPLFSAGFYYKTFMWPPQAWAKLYEPIIRRAAGLGAAPTDSDPDRYCQRHSHCEVLIVGAGPAGLAAALSASEPPNTRVILVDEQAELGGTLLHDTTSEIDGRSAADWLTQTLATLAARANVTILPRTTAFGYFNHNHICCAERLSDHRSAAGRRARERLWQIRAAKVIIAAGSHERPLVFADNDRPGILLADSIRTYINRYGVAPGRNLIIATSGASAYQTAIDARAAGLQVRIIELRRADACGPELIAARSAGIDVRTEHTVVGTRGRKRVTGLIVAPLRLDGRVGRGETLACDCVGMSGGWTPAVHLFSQSRGKLAFDPALDTFVPTTSVQAELSAGACRGTYDLAACLADGAHAGGRPRTYQATPSLTGFQPVRVMPTSRPEAKVKAFVDFQNDVTAKDIRLAVSEGFQSIEHVKRYTTSGMATDQGKTSNINTLGIAAHALAKAIPQVGLTTFRQPYTPVSFGAFAGANRGDLFDPTRVTAIHNHAAKLGAVFEDVALWKRAWYFPKAGEDIHAAVRRECLAVRRDAGLFDASTLGKIDVSGPDAAEFLNRIYTNAWTKLQPGRCRYGLMLKEDGFIMDDGVVARIADDRFHVTTTTGGAARVFGHMEDYLQTEWPDLRVFLTSTTEQWAVIALQGPKARAILSGLVTDIDLSPAAFPHMAWRDGSIAGVPARIMRASFTGELGYEINVPSDYGGYVWDALLTSGAAVGLTPYGTEAMHVLRAEKGYIIIGQDTDGTLIPDDAGLGGLIAKSKPDFVGKRSLTRSDLVKTDRKQLVGLLTTNPSERLEEGAQIVATPEQPIPMAMLGHVTSSYDSPTLGHTLALAVIASGRARHGQIVHITTAAGFTTARVTDPVFLDPEGNRLHV
jgi:sarcosine oxidase, subunit alpha